MMNLLPSYYPGNLLQLH